jgi:hypothetical protein
MFGRVLAVLRRQWWLVVAVVLAAAITGYVASLKTADVYTSVATIMMDTAPSARYRGMPVADDLVKEITGSKVRSMVASSLSVDEAEVAGNLRAAAAGNPLTTIRVTYAAGTKDRADAGARAAALEAIAYVRTTMSKEVAFREQQIAASEQALSAFDAASRQTPLALNATYERWTIQTQLIDYKVALEGILGVYTYDGSVTSSLSSASDVRLKNALAGAVVGLAFGILLAGAREALRVRA